MTKPSAAASLSIRVHRDVENFLGIVAVLDSPASAQFLISLAKSPGF
jgi:hypothetical protein